jgi:hypothetical protein
MNDIERSQWMDVLDRAAAKLERGEAGSDADWMALVTEGLGLPFLYLPAVQVAVAQGRWRTAKNPKAYVRSVAKREAAKMNSAQDFKSTLKIPKDLRNEHGETLSPNEYIDFLCADCGPVKRDGVWRARVPMEEPIFADEEDPRFRL